MKLTVREAARLLSVSESELYRWVDDGQIPFYLINHQPLFSRAELLEWAMARHLPLSPELFEEGARAVHLADALAHGGVHRDVEGDDRDAVLRAVVARLPIDDEEDRDMVLSVLLAREAQLSTGVGRGIAIPHVRAPLVFAGTPAAIALCFLARPVAFGAIDAAPVHTVFAMVTPTIRGHLQLLSRLSYALHDAAFKAVLERRAPTEEILEAARRVDQVVTDAKHGGKNGNGSGNGNGNGKDADEVGD
jgi:PTS system nitrogen regulatory IIA component